MENFLLLFTTADIAQPFLQGDYINLPKKVIASVIGIN